MSGVLYIAAKAPRPGLAKTRLGGEIGHEAANALYSAFLEDLAARFSGVAFDVGWYVTPDDGWPEVETHVGESERVLFQGEGDWTTRQDRLFREAPARGEDSTILIASDSPQLEAGTVERAFRELEEKDLVLGPTSDGGYYLIGMRGYHDVLGEIPMSTDTVLGDITIRAGRMGLSLGRVEDTFDVDEAEDLEGLREIARNRVDLPATRAALREIESHPAHPGWPASAAGDLG